MKLAVLSLVGWLLLAIPVSAQKDSPNETLTLAGILELAVRHSPAIAAATSKADAMHFGAQATLDSSGLRLTTSAGILVDPIEEKRLIRRSSLEDLSRDEVFNSTILDVRATLSWPILAKNIDYRADAEEAAARAADSQIIATRHRVFLSIVRNYYQLLMLNRAIKAAEASMEALKETKRGVEKKIEVGRSPPIDLFRINSRLSKIELDLLSFLNERKKRVLRLEELVGVDFARSAKFADELRQPEANFGQRESVQIAIEERPEAQSAVSLLEEAHARENIADSVFSPKISLVLEPSLSYGDNAEQVVEDVFIGARITMPIFDPAYSATKDKAVANIWARKWRLETVRRKVRSQVKAALLDLDKAGKSIQVTEKLVETATEAFRAEQRRYKAGYSTINDILEAQATLLQARLSKAQSLVQYNIARTEMYWARGDMTIEKLAPKGVRE